MGAVLSVLVWQELMTGAVLKGSDFDGVIGKILRDLDATKFAPVTQTICERAVTPTKQHDRRIYGYDAIHIATALEHKATVFVTNDVSLLNVKVEGLEIRGLEQWLFKQSRIGLLYR